MNSPVVAPESKIIDLLLNKWHKVGLNQWQLSPISVCMVQSDTCTLMLKVTVKVWQTFCAVTGLKCITQSPHHPKCDSTVTYQWCPNYQDGFLLLGLVLHCKLRGSTEGGLFISGICSAKSSRFLHKFKHFPDVRRYKTFHCFESGLPLVPWSSLQTLPPLFSGKSGPQARRSSFFKGFRYCRATAFWCQCHHRTQCPSCLFQHFVSIRCGRPILSIHCLLHCMQLSLLLPPK